ncbi:hypothetical protein [Microbulbifer sediminum]|uniref:hypothetical protein n=1 Tax=Microbulbifer sediminum TaxID=2904250 RepID=UPI001F452928|nr:hypothetical protein [Microbulbifer sediminum]
MRPVILLAIVTTAVGAASCSSSATDNDRAMREFFDTHITGNDAKRFEYTMHIRPPERRGRSRSTGKGRGGTGTPGNAGNRADWQARMEAIWEKYLQQMSLKLREGVKAKLAETGYCQEGYMELERVVTRGRLSLRGECRDGATDEDRKRFPNPTAPKPRADHRLTPSTD